MSYLKKVIGMQVKFSKELYLLYDKGNLVLVPKKILEVREKKLRSKIIKEYFVQWK